MCGPTSAIGLVDEERMHWPWLRERLRVPGHCMGLMRGVLGSDAEVAAVIATNHQGVSRALAVVATPPIAAEITMPDLPAAGDSVVGQIADDDVEVLVAPGTATPAAMMITPWMRQHLYLYARQLWWPPRRVAHTRPIDS